MKKLIIILFAAAVNIFCQDWTTVSSPEFAGSLSDIFFVNQNTGWVVASDGIIAKTTDGGASWIQQNSNTTKDLARIFFLDENHGWVGTGNNFFGNPGGSVLRTTDGGQNWVEHDFSPLLPWVNLVYCDAIVFTSPTIGHLIAGKLKLSYLFKTTDGGQNWVIKDSLSGTSFVRWYDMSFHNADRGAIVGNKKDIGKYTTDGGDTWLDSTPIVDGFFGDLRSVKWLDDNTVLAMGEGNEFNGVPTPLYKSSDGGATWVKKTILPPNSYDRIKDSYFKDGSNGIAMGSNGFSYAFIYKTTDGGESWTPSSAPFGFGIRDVTGSGDFVYALGTGSHMIKSTDFGESWEIVPVKPLSSFYGLQFIGSKGFAVTLNGDLLVSTDNGVNWSYKSNAGKWNAGDAQFFDENTGIVHKENRYIVKTTNGGSTWYDVLSSLPFSSRNKVGGLHFPSNNVGYAWMSLIDYAEYYVFKSTDAGESWNQIWNMSGPGSLSGGIAFFDENTGFIGGPNLWLKRTTDGGQTWIDGVINNMPAGFESKDFDEVSVLNSTTAWAVGEQFILKTENAGVSWEYVNHGITGIDSNFYTIEFNDAMNGYVGCYDGNILQTSDGGINWSLETTFFESEILYEAAFNQFGKIFFATSDGKIIGYDVLSNVNDENNILPGEFILEQNYPNPFNPVTTIKFSISSSVSSTKGRNLRDFSSQAPRNDNVRLVIYDVLGNEIAILVNEIKLLGTYAVDFSADSYSSGVYFYKLTVGEFSATRKMLLLK